MVHLPMSSHSFALIGVGSPIVDTLARVPESFLSSVEGEKGGMELVDAHAMGALLSKVDEAGATMVEATGGSAGNTAVGLARLGLPVTFLGKTGPDAGGEFYINRFKQVGGDSSRFKIGEVANGRCLSLVTPDSERTMRTDLGAAATLSPDEISKADFESVKHAHIEGYLLFNGALLEKVLSSAKEAGCTISLDLASFEVVRAAGAGLVELLKNSVDVVFANEDEATAFAELNGAKNPADFESIAASLGELCDVAVVKLGGEGSLVFSKGELTRIEPVKVASVVDTTGAGDLWAAGFLFGWLGGRDLRSCGNFGSLLGAEVVQILGAEIPADRWEVLRGSLA